MKLISKTKNFLLILLLSISTLQVQAHHEGVIGGPGIAGPIITFPARTLPKGRFFAGVGLKYTNFNTFSAAQVQSLVNRRETTGQIAHSLAPSINFGYGITDDLDIYLTLPYQFKYGLVETDAGERTGFGDSIGLGDLLVLCQYRFLKLERHKLYASLLAGINIPTGFRNVRNNEGDFFGNDDQPGSGTFDPLVGLALSKDLGAGLSLDSNFLYRFSLKGPRDNTIGDTLNYNFAISYLVQHDALQSENKRHGHSHAHSGELAYHTHKHMHNHTHDGQGHHKKISKLGRFLTYVLPGSVLGNKLRWNLVSEINYTWQERPEDSEGVKEDNHGGHLVQATQGIRAIVNDRLVTNLGVSLPLATGFNGAQPSPIPSLTFGVNYLF